MILGLGHDVTDVAAFGEQLTEPGSRMRALFSARELRQSALRAQAKRDGEAVHLAARWAGKEAVVKAWCEALALGAAPVAPPYTLDDCPWSGIEILDDARGVPRVALRGDVEERLAASLRAAGVLPAAGAADVAAGAADVAADAAMVRWHLSLSHDGPIASAVAVLDLLDLPHLAGVA
ncbi:Holo-[acyl-carrier protein] synthase [Bifidobacterium sp. DSM 109958]|uniref:Holo-[acyl-carrier-protein] synthase n=1 Tax=Bifidobacterium moraviense TaxID=2675323 RepID=A0A7Y0HYH4_9BIFI|nr:holo-ACP synthase [Bifidobacterium sp. DSM 109958]NMN01296.1 Holo-[acyl-carrier protein] synthase [Bifidobacterium sp. DSM 109958]